MQKIYQDEMLLRTIQCDFMGKWRPGAIFEAMQEASGMHSYLLGCGRDVLVKQNVVWVLSRIEVQMEKYPGIADTVRVETFPAPNRRWFFPRYFTFKDQAGNLLGSASSLWVLLDIVSRKMVPPGDVARLIPDNSDLTLPMGLPETAWEAEGVEELSVRMPAYTDLDVNQHVNNTKYADWLCDALGIEALRENCLKSICINYEQEVRPGQEVTLRLKRNGQDFSLYGFHGEQRCFAISGKLMPR